jgi:hypothetical protein
MPQTCILRQRICMARQFPGKRICAGKLLKINQISGCDPDEWKFLVAIEADTFLA